MKKVELLAPAGGYETMVGAFNAGADAVYLGGSKFGARAYADNFDKEQVLDAISYAHLFGKRIYMTVNTLVKEREFGQLYDFMLPFAEKNLDGVIVQDLGVMKFIRDEFPGIELHASTQQTVTGVYGAKLLKKLGCCRVVPARELSIDEMKAIRKEADIEVEAFIHGAMCYCYSGACLFSSMVGTRSGNRGRCAQPCRLPYHTKGNNKELYPLSLKDMCTIDIISELIEAGIDSFKIEGRMKKPEYAAGVTALYRKYIDLYYQNPGSRIKVSKEDLEILKSLYLRTGISEGYYYRHNGKEMVTISSPAYNGTSDKVLEDIRGKFLGGQMKIKCGISCMAVFGEPLTITMHVDRGGEEFWENVTGNPVEAASKRPMDRETIVKQLSRLGNTVFEAKDIDVVIDERDHFEGIFVPISELNDLRRQLCSRMEEALGKRDVSSESDGTLTEHKNASSENCRNVKKSEAPNDDSGNLHVLVSTKEQLKSLLEKYRQGGFIKRVYVDSNLFFTLEDELKKEIKALSDGGNIEFIVALPFVTRKESWKRGDELANIVNGLSGSGFTGVLARNLEQLGFIYDWKSSGKSFAHKVITDYGVYVWNHESASLLEECGDIVDEISIPLELTIHEAKELTDSLIEHGMGNIPVSYNVYGRAPMMISAGCVKKTFDNCSGKMGENHSETLSIIDRIGNVMPITTNCRNCYNVIWNAQPTSLHRKFENIMRMKAFDNFRIDLSVENERETLEIIETFTIAKTGKSKDMAVTSGYEYVEEGVPGHGRKFMEELKYTTGHFKRGVE